MLHSAQNLAPLRIPDFEIGVFNRISYSSPAPLYVEAMEVDRYSLGARPRERARVASVQGEVKLELSEGTLRSRMTQGRVVHHLVLLPHLQKDSNDAKQTFRISHITRCAMGWH
jgi:hypothetical protein